MSQGIFITGTGTDIGKTYATAALIKAMRQRGLSVGYYKAAISGATSVATSDAGFVKDYCQLTQPSDSLLSYLYEEAVSPHLAAERANRPIALEIVHQGYQRVAAAYDWVVMEGSGGILCPLRRFSDGKLLLLEDVIASLALPSLIVADAGLGTINATVLTIEYMKRRGLAVLGVVFNHYTGDWMQKDNWQVIEQLSHTPIVATIADGGDFHVVKPILDMEVDV